jgi:hypothetical protein
LGLGWVKVLDVKVCVGMEVRPEAEAKRRASREEEVGAEGQRPAR